MTIIEAISRIDNFKHNTYSQEEKITWLSRLDHLIKDQIMDVHEGAQHINFSGYDENTPQDTVLLVPAPYDEVYLRWLEAQIDYANGEIGKYNNAILLYNAAYEGFANYYTRTHLPLSHGSRFLF